MRFVGIVTFAAAALSCTPSLTKDLSAYWPVNEYRKLTCAELAEEGRAISKKGFMLSGLKAGLGGSDGTATAPAIVFVWPPGRPDSASLTPGFGTRARECLPIFRYAEIASQP